MSVGVGLVVEAMPESETYATN